MSPTVCLEQVAPWTWIEKIDPGLPASWKGGGKGAVCAEHLPLPGGFFVEPDVPQGSPRLHLQGIKLATKRKEVTEKGSPFSHSEGALKIWKREPVALLVQAFREQAHRKW